MPRKPNYQFERMERDRAKAAKKAEKAAERERERAAEDAQNAPAADDKQD